MGDFNAKSKLWGDRLTTSKWNTMAEVVDFYNFIVLNDGGYTFKSSIGSVLDLSFSRLSCDVKFSIFPFLLVVVIIRPFVLRSLVNIVAGSFWLKDLCFPLWELWI